MNDIEALQREAMKRIADVIENVQAELSKAQEELLSKYFADPDPMPVFVFQAKDAFAMSAITSYYSSCLMAGLKEHAAEVFKAMNDFREWQRRNPDRMKTPDKEHVPLPRMVEVTSIDKDKPEYLQAELPADFPHGKIPEFCNWCPDPRNPNPLFHKTGAAHIQAGASRLVGRPIRDNPQA